MTARCVRPDCDLPAAARLSARFGDREGWLCDVDGAEVSPHDYLLCARHADSLSLPMHWVLHDDRSRRIASFPTPARAVSSDSPAPLAEEAITPSTEADPAEHQQEPVPADDGSMSEDTAELAGPAAAPDLPDPPDAPALEPEEPAARYDPADEVDDSMPLLSRAFRAAVPGSDERD